MFTVIVSSYNCETQTKKSRLTCLWVHFLIMADILHLPQLNIKISAHFQSQVLKYFPSQRQPVQWATASHLQWGVDKGLF